MTNSVAQHLADQQVGYWDPDGAYPASPELPPIFAKRFPPNTADQAFTVTAYTVQETVSSPVETWRIQIRTRSPYDADPLADQAKRCLAGARLQTWGNLTIQACVHLSTSQLGLDTKDRDERSDNYQITLLR